VEICEALSRIEKSSDHWFEQSSQTHTNTGITMSVALTSSSVAEPPNERRFILGGLTVEQLCSMDTRRCHLVLDGRYVTVLEHRGAIFALDSPCYHAAGPLGEGSVVDIEDIPCIRCPWHQFLVALDTGEEITRKAKAPNFQEHENDVFLPPTYPMQPPSEDAFEGPAIRGGRQVQRLHRTAIDSETGDIVVFLADVDVMRQRPVRSDTNACHQRGAMSMQIRDIKLRGLE
jgi:nitrite reductase/ring-hydroxylating ferredoxin subunit